MSFYEPSAVASYLSTLLNDASLHLLAPGGVHETDAADPLVGFGTTTAQGQTAPRVETPYVVYSHLASSDTQGAGGTILVADLDYAVQVMYRRGEEYQARQALGRLQDLLEGIEAEVAESGTTPAHALTVRSRGAVPRLSMREAGGRLIYSEGRRWLIRVQRI